MKRYNEYNRLDLTEIQKTMLAEWEKNDLFRQSVTTRKGHTPFLFFEGPPSANGMPGIHHVLARTIKDTFCRFKTMQGFEVRRKAGWDTHGLPVELGVEKKLGITKEDIGKKISVDEYNAQCRSEVMKYTKEWTALTKQMGYWVDLDNPYITYDNKYIESCGTCSSNSTRRAICTRVILSSPTLPLPARASRRTSSTSPAATAT